MVIRLLMTTLVLAGATVPMFAVDDTQATPEPGTMMMVGVCLIVLGSLRQRNSPRE